MKRKILIALLSIICTLCLVFGFTACGGNGQGSLDNGGSSSGGGTEQGGSIDGGDDDSEQGGSTDGGDGAEQGDLISGGDITTHTHMLSKTEAKDSTCAESGNIEYWYCSDCGKYFSDENGTIEIFYSDIVLAKQAHDMTHTEAVAATAYSDGNIEYWYCSVCDKYYSDENGTTVISQADTVLAATPAAEECSFTYVDRTFDLYTGDITFYKNDTEWDGLAAAGGGTSTITFTFSSSGKGVYYVNYNLYGSQVYEITINFDYTEKQCELLSLVYTADIGSYGNYVTFSGYELILSNFTLAQYNYAGVDLMSSVTNAAAASEMQKYVIGYNDFGLYVYGMELSGIVTANGETVCYTMYGRLADKAGGNNGHTAVTIKENEVAATCVDAGSYDSVVYCSVCGKELSRATVAIPATGHEINDDGICAICGQTCWSEGLNYSWDSSTSSYIVKGKGTCTDTDIIIPSKVNGYPVTSIGTYAFQFCTAVSITIPDSVTSISDYAFYCCYTKNVIFGNSVASIGEYAFHASSKLESVTLPDTVTSIGNQAFGYCTSLASVVIGSRVTSISYAAFRNCTSLKSVSLGDNVTSIGNQAFGYCTSLTSITIPDNVTSIDSEAFYGCTALTSAIIGDSVTSIGSKAFYDCTALTSVIIGDSVTSIGSYAFYGCTALTSAIMGDSVKSISSGAFQACGSLTSITIPREVSSIAAYAFTGCVKLVEVYNLSSLEITVGSTDNGYLAYYAKNIYTPTSGKSNLIYDGDYIFYNEDGTYYLMGYVGSDTDIILPENINGNNYSLYEAAFKDCVALESIVIPESIISISNSAFYNCTALTSITIPDNVSSIGNYSFYNCTSLKSITIPDNVSSIGNSAFSGCTSLTSITIPDNVTSIGNYSFYNCTSLTSITIPDSVTSIGNDAFSGCTSFTSITIPDSVTSIGSKAFYGCTSLTSITIPDGVTSIGTHTFYGCTSLTSITIPDGVTSIGNSAFYGCTSLTSITIPDSVTSIGAYTFSSCASLVSVTFKNTSGWYFATSLTATSGTDVDVTDISQNTIYLTSTYYNYYWFRSDN